MTELNKPQTMLSSTLDTVAGHTQDFTPTKQICEYLNAFHVYGDDKSRYDGFRQHKTSDSVGILLRVFGVIKQYLGLIYDSAEKDAKLIGVEYMIPKQIWNTLPDEEKQYWHTHECEVKSGMLIMPRPAGMPNAVWEASETKALEGVVNWYGKTFHFWQVDKGDVLPLGPPKLMKSFTNEFQLPQEILKSRNEKFDVDQAAKKKARTHIKPEIDDTNDKKFWEGEGFTLDFRKVKMK
ncbi:hypothetical protein E3Q23_03622 [Wallemia mellicola]|uniref:DUF1264-domain-containing protein n=1 Tax=Wallemia mellicola TaxID=1708541 RepID=A0A4T0U5B3_9BASI|nr:hypothetical protein E3Q24_03716 [Wallemia mellicola]TIB71844.1 hypothetical protein E3Q23_03622 [Wallemia mellicola]TIB90073.1 DUF1264-domain-containing protein [Wallemia mellicola]TIC25305.1 DUF1264-domain-containing protein [Wallemia mellicola]TIC61766.1 DUF1264-domain-containing protein [Wallemia mellicola]